jgi:hypothetical protein
MIIDPSGIVGAEHARDLRREAEAYRAGQSARAHRGLREFIARGLLGPADNYRAR